MNIEEVRGFVTGHSFIRDVDLLPTGPFRFETGFMYPEGSSVEVFLVSEEPMFPTYKLTDLGQTTNWLLNVQVKPWLSKKRQALLEDAIRLYGVRQNGGALEYPLARLEDLPKGIVLLGQACLRVADLVFTRRTSLQLPFVEDVEEVLADTELSYEPNVELPGRFGKPIRVEFVVHGARTRSAVLTLASTTASAAHINANEVFRRWYDLMIPERTEQRVTIYDDARSIYRDEDIHRLEGVSCVVGLSDRQAVRDLLAA